MAVNQTSTIKKNGTWGSKSAALDDIIAKAPGISIFDFLKSKIADGGLTNTISFNGSDTLTMQRTWTDEAWAEYLKQTTGKTALEAAGYTCSETNNAS